MATVKNSAAPDFNRLLEKEIPRLRRYALTLTRDAEQADDLIQETLTRALTKAHLWRPGSDLRAWAFTIMHNRYVDEVRRIASEGSPVNIEPDTNFPQLSVRSAQHARIELHDVFAIIRKLPEEQAEILLLIGRDGLRYDEAAHRLGIPVGTVRSRLWRGREMLKESLDAPPAAATGPHHDKAGFPAATREVFAHPNGRHGDRTALPEPNRHHRARSRSGFKLAGQT